MSRVLDIGKVDKDDISDKAKYRDIRNILLHILQVQQQQHKILEEEVLRSGALLNTNLKEGDRGGVLDVSTPTGTFKFTAQTHDVELVNTIIVRLPVTVTNPRLILDNGSLVVPLQAGYTFLSNLLLPVVNIEREITWTNAQTTDTIACLILATPAPGNMPGVLH
jgi:hypothetical protein